MRARTALCLAVLSSCARHPAEAEAAAEVRAEFGVLYGEQVQERQELPLVRGRTQQRVGFRLQRSPPPEAPLLIRWELGKPAAARKSRGLRAPEGPRRIQGGQAEWSAGEAVFERALPFQPGDPLGLWNIRVLSGDRVLIDRPFLVFDPQQRERERGGLNDAG